MKILALETSAKAASVCIAEDGRLIGQYYQNSGLTHSRTLLPMVQDLLANLELHMADIGLVAVARGPGSFTGLRIGVATAKGLAQALSLPCCGVSTLEAMAWQAAASFFDGVICPVMDARRGQIYNALFANTGDGPTRLVPDRAIALEQLAAEIEKSGKAHFLVGDGAALCYNALQNVGLPVFLAPENLRFQSAFGVAAAAQTGDRCTAEELVPVYLRLSQAERERMERLHQSNL